MVVPVSRIFSVCSRTQPSGLISVSPVNAMSASQHRWWGAAAGLRSDAAGRRREDAWASARSAPPRRGCMTIAGTDSGGGAGVAADLRAITACGVHGCLAVTAVTVQNSLGVTGVHILPPEMVAAQIEAVATDIGLDAAKTGMLATTRDHPGDRRGLRPRPGSAPTARPRSSSTRSPRRCTATRCSPTRRSTRTGRCCSPGPPSSRRTSTRCGCWSGIDVHDRAAQYEAAKMLHALGPRYVLVKGGHLAEDTDIVRRPALRRSHVHRAARAAVRHRRHPRQRRQHGVGASPSGLARGLSVPDAIAFGKRFVVEAVRHSYPLGAGHGPVSPPWAIGPGGAIAGEGVHFCY